MSKVNHEVLDVLAQFAMDRPPVKGLPVTPHTVRRVGIVGANPTGIGIAMSLLDADIPVTVFELERASLDMGIALARSAYQDAVLDGRLTTAGRERRMALLAGSINFHHLKDCDLVIDTVSTDIEVKGKLFRRLDQTVKPSAILVTCTSPAGVDHLAASTRRAGEVLGVHLSSPPHVGETWTLIPGKRSSGQALATVVALVQQLGKACVVSGDWDSDAGRAEADAVPWQVDQAMD
ncbi:MAG: 3-hydroxyacyl-CoA dehydrogenase family protein [Telluria sp.]